MTILDDALLELIRRGVREELVANGAIREELRAALASQPEARVSDEDRDVTTLEAAELAHVQPRTINAWTRQGLLTPTKRGRSNVYRAGDVLAVARDRRSPRKIIDIRKSAQAILKGRDR